MASLYNKLMNYIKHVLHEGVSNTVDDKLNISFKYNEHDTLVKQGKFFDNIG